MNNLLNEPFLLKYIEKMKEKLVETAYKTGINSQETIAYSQELDNLLNLHMKHFSPKGKHQVNAS